MRLETLTKSAVGFVAAAVVLGVLFYVVGVGDVTAALAGARLSLLVVVAAAIFGWLVSWSITLRTVLDVLDLHLPLRRVILVYGAAAFANNVTPFGQAGGEPIAGWIIADAADTEYETGLASIASVDALNFVPSISLAVIGVGYYATSVTLSGRLELVAGGVVALAVLVPVAAVLGWRHRYAVERYVVGLLTPALRWLGRVLPGRSAPEPARLRERIEGFFRAIERVATDQRSLLVAIGFSAVGWLLHAAALWIAFLALGSSIPVYVVLFVVPIGAIAGVLPTPGGLGGIEVILVSLLTLVTGVDLATATAAVTIYRVGGFVLVTTFGGAAMAVLQVQSRALAGVEP